MSQWETLTCVNHPDRIALERCEVCQKPLCAYCLYYTEDGQRLCAEHAEEARRLGLRVEEPGAYADQLLGAQVGADRKTKRERDAVAAGVYTGNSTDLLGFIGLLVGGVSLVMCCGAGYCLPLVGFVLSLIALINARRSFNPRRTRRMGVLGLLVSGVWVVIIAACIATYGLSISSVVTAFRGTTWHWPTAISATETPTPSPTPAPTPLPDGFARVAGR
ncbi:MAG: hypothetical protein KBH93_02435 [Anaerolineae bacterium]|nr:hypothetical protein [Anaerolineae bacterium]